MSGPHAVVTDLVGWLRRHAPGACDLRIDSRRVGPGDVFIALPGARADGRDFIDTAVKLGAVAVVAEAGDRPPRAVGVPLYPVTGLAPLLGQLAAAYYGHPSERLLSIAVTGTNGKTSSAIWIARLLSAEGLRCGVIGTIGTGFVDAEAAPLADAILTTPDAVSLQKSVRDLLYAGARAASMEVSSIGLDQGRVRGMKYDIALFTNLTHDHLDYHGTMAAYEAAKTKLFDWPTLSHVVLNLDDAAGRRLAERSVGRGLRTIGYGRGEAPGAAGLALRVVARNVHATPTGIACDVVLETDGRPTEFVHLQSALIGAFNISNLLGVIGVALAAGIGFGQACAAAAALRPPPGRMQVVVSADRAAAPLVLVDYAHTPDALENVLTALQPLAQARAGKLWVVFGAGGDRDPAKRAPMGRIAARLADHVVITSDNPRSEVPATIVGQIGDGAGVAPSVTIVIDRGRAIVDAIGRAAPADVVLIAGKGHETYQEIQGVRTPFSDAQHAAAALAARAFDATAPVVVERSARARVRTIR